MENNTSIAGSAGNGTGIAGSTSISTRDAAVNVASGVVREAVTDATTSPGGAGLTGRVSVSFMTRHPDAQFVVDTARILAGMTGNTAFPAPAPNLATVIAARNTYTAAVTAGLDSRLGRSQRQKARAALVVLLRQLAHYVEDTSGADRTLMMSSGFPLQRVRTPVGELPAPVQVRLVKGKTTGTAVARCGKLDQARAYQWRLAPAATPTTWSPVITTFAAHAQFEALTPMTAYVVQVCAVGTAGTGNWSETAAALVL
jgi:hypothetical protein